MLRVSISWRAAARSSRIARRRISLDQPRTRRSRDGQPVNRNGTLLATILYGFEETLSLDTAPNFNYVHNLGAAVGGVAFAAQTDTL